MKQGPEALALRAAPSPSASRLAALAADALHRGQTGSPDALRWLERAVRLAPADDTLVLTLAGNCLARDPTRAAVLLEGVTARADVREAWLALAAARHAVADPQGAAAALAQALSRHVCVERVGAMARAVARGAGAPGWCGVGPGGHLLVRALRPDAPISLSLNGCRLALVSRLPAASGRLSVTVAGRHLLGSPIALEAMRRVEGFVRASDGGIEGWAWHPGDPDRDPTIHLRPLTGGPGLKIKASLGGGADGLAGLLGRPRIFRVPASALAGIPGPLRVIGAGGRELLGSPLDPRWEEETAAAAALILARRFPAKPGTSLPRRRLTAPPAISADAPRPAGAVGAVGQRRATDVVIPVCGGGEAVLACIDSVLGTVPEPSRVIVVDDASPDPDLARALGRLAASGRVRLIRHRRNRGFPASANAGLMAARGRDVALLNSDTLVPARWLSRLREAAYSARDIGTATPLSNNGSIVSIPGPAGANPVPDLRETRRLAALAHRANAGAVVEIPVGVGFCLYIRRDCLDTVGLLRTDVFAQGYGEENDFCLRARHLGWRHVAAAGVFVAHLGQRSFGAAGAALRARNAAVLNRLHPGYDRLIEEHVAADPLAVARRKIDTLRWRAASRFGPHDGANTRGAVVLLAHAEGGGVERQIAAACKAHRAEGRRAIVLRPARAAAGGRAVVVGDGTEGGYPGLVFAIPDELPALARLLSVDRPEMVEIHHLLGHHPAVARLPRLLGAAYEVHLHDYAWFCPRVVLLGSERRYCGEPNLSGCEDCITDLGNLLGEEISPKELRLRSSRTLGGARRVIAPSHEAAARIRRHFPAIRPAEVVPHEDDLAVPEPPPIALGARGPVRVCVVGAIGIPKGYDVLLACARDAATRSLPLDFVVVGHTIDDARLIATGRVFVTGEFAPHEATKLIQAQAAHLALLPSIVPETWCFALTEAWRAGLRVAAFDIGAPAERIRTTGRGFLLPLGLSIASINHALVAAVRPNVHEWASRSNVLLPRIVPNVTAMSEPANVRSRRPDRQPA